MRKTIIASAAAIAAFVALGQTAAAETLRVGTECTYAPFGN